jgi:N-methylhydantoinase A
VTALELDLTTRIGVDVGGTFTDIVAIGAGGRRSVLKLPTTPVDQSIGVMEGLDRIRSPDATVAFLGHGTTAGTNAFLTRRGARTALVTTAGFEDILEFRRMDRSGVMDPYDLQIDFPAPLVPGRLRLGVDERVAPGGVVERELTGSEIARVVARLRALAPEAVAICLLWSFAHPDHERRLALEIAEALPELYVSVSHELDPAIGEYERTSSTVINAYLGPLIRRYLGSFANAAHARGLPAPTVMQSNGGMTSIRGAVDRPAALLASGPAAGFSAAADLARRQGELDLLAIDMGGTSFETAVVLDGEAQQVLETELEGHALRMPMLDIRSIGAGGGSIAWVDEAGALRVGPQSAGADPGPACYGRGGGQPTVSDANVVLGYLGQLAGGALTLDRGAAEAVLTIVGAPLGLDVTQAANGVYRLVNAHMADAMRLIASERGIDPAHLTLMAYGGAGPTHAAALARELGIARTIIPTHPGALSALGVATGDIARDYAQSVLLTVEDLDLTALEHRFAALEDEARRALEADGVPAERRELHRGYVARYVGQLHDLEVDLDGLDLRSTDITTVALRFHERHRATYGFAVDSESVFALSIRVRAVGRIPKPADVATAAAGRPAASDARLVWFAETGYVETPVYERLPWSPGASEVGPAIIAEYDSTTVVLPGQRFACDATGSLLIEEATR